jgi:hypothetical protein
MENKEGFTDNSLGSPKSYREFKELQDDRFQLARLLLLTVLQETED